MSGVLKCTSVTMMVSAISIYCWADPERDLSGALLTTGKGIIGPHLPALVALQMQINRQTLGR